MNTDTIKAWLLGRGITESVLTEFEVSCNSSVVIPVKDEHNMFVFNKYRRNPFLDDKGPKYWYDKSGKTTLYGAFKIKDAKYVVICEGELDALRLWSMNIPAVTSTGGAMSFKEEWAPLFDNKEVYVCFDNDHAGALGMVRLLKFLPNAKVILIPSVARVKDITDYMQRGGDFSTLMSNAKTYTQYEQVHQDRVEIAAHFNDTTFHDVWLEEYEKKIFDAQKDTRDIPKSSGNDRITRAKDFPIDRIVKVGRNNKFLCPFHNDTTPSMHLYRKNNTAFCFVCRKSADSIALYQEIHKCTFTEALNMLDV